MASVSLVARDWMREVSRTVKWNPGSTKRSKPKPQRLLKCGSFSIINFSFLHRGEITVPAQIRSLMPILVHDASTGPFVIWSKTLHEGKYMKRRRHRREHMWRRNFFKTCGSVLLPRRSTRRKAEENKMKHTERLVREIMAAMNIKVGDGVSWNESIQCDGRITKWHRYHFNNSQGWIKK